jgi:hypothetical protein
MPVREGKRFFTNSMDLNRRVCIKPLRVFFARDPFAYLFSRVRIQVMTLKEL